MDDLNDFAKALRLGAFGYRTMLAARLSNGKSNDLTADDVANLAIHAFITACELKQRLDAYEQKRTDAWLSVAEAMQQAACSKATIFRAIKEGELQSQKVNGRRVIDRLSLERFAQFRVLMHT